MSKIDSLIGREVFAIALISFSQLIFPFAFLYVSQHDVSPIVTNLARGVTSVIVHAALFWYFGISFDIPRFKDMKPLFFRCTIMVFHQLVYTGMYYVLSFAVLNTLATTGPLFVFILDYFMNSNHINKKQFVGIILGIIGVVIIINGDQFMALIDEDYHIVTDFKNYKVTDFRLKVLFSVALVLCNVAWAYSIMLQKRISHISGIKISFYMGVQFVISSGIIYSFGIVPSVSSEVFLSSCIFTGLLITLVQIMFITSLNLSKNSGVLTLSVFLGIISSNLISVYRFNETINPLSATGMVLVVYGITKTTLNK